MITKESFSALALRWGELNEIYDNSIRDLFQVTDLSSLPLEKLQEMEAMQKELFELETQLLKYVKARQ